MNLNKIKKEALRVIRLRAGRYSEKRQQQILQHLRRIEEMLQAHLDDIALKPPINNQEVAALYEGGNNA